MFERMEDMISIGAYEAGSNPELDQVITLMPEIRRFLQQAPDEFSSNEESAQRLLQLVSKMSYEESLHETQNVQNIGAAQRAGPQ
jgi:flagellum-specific ATP synthase